MEKRLYNIITTPGMVVTVAMAIGLLLELKDSWLHQVAFVAILIAYHFTAVVSSNSWQQSNVPG